MPEGIAKYELEDQSSDLTPLFETILSKIEGPIADDNKITQFLVTNLDFDSYVGQVAIGRLNHGKLEMNTHYSPVSYTHLTLPTILLV